MVLQFGLRLWSLWAWRGLDPGAGSLIQGFSIPGRVVMIGVACFAVSWCC